MKNHVLFILLLFPVLVLGQKRADILIRNGKIIEGAGNSWYYGDVAIKKDKILAIGNLDNYKAKRVINANRQVVSPGFIDVHTHIEGDEKVTPTADNFIYDGVTTVITGNCGSSNVDLKEYFKMLGRSGISVNVASFIGHNSVRNVVLGTSSRTPDHSELKEMQDLVEQAMKDGAMGFSTGLIYIPGTYAKTEEVISLAQASARHHGIYTSHIRNESKHIVEALNEAIDVGRKAGMPVQISHFKLGSPMWGKSDITLGMIDQARKEGIEVTIDQYPYTASSTSLNAIIPSWALEHGRDSVLWRLRTPSVRKKLIDEMIQDMEGRKRPDFSYAVVANFRADTSYNGKNISEINVMMGRKSTIPDEIETILYLLEKGGASMVYHSMKETDVENIMQYPFTMIASDSGIREFGAGVPHPRGYGTNARVLSRYVRDRNIMKLEEAIRKMTSLPAQKYGLKDRGLLRAGMKADIVIFDPETVTDEATYQRPHAFSRGFQYVLVNGKLTVDNFKHNQTLNGEILYGPGYNRNNQ